MTKGFGTFGIITGLFSCLAIGANMKTPPRPENHQDSSVLLSDKEGNLILNLKNPTVQQKIEKQLKIASKIRLNMNESKNSDK